jgi:predicted NBD/HSP70 family sugar kinase
LEVRKEESRRMTEYSLGIDIGGTFTDIVLVRADGT